MKCVELNVTMVDHAIFFFFFFHYVVIIEFLQKFYAPVKDTIVHNTDFQEMVM